MTRLARIVNAIPSALLHTPIAHRAMSGRYAVLEFTGRRSGRSFRTPIAYTEDRGRILLSTDSAWWRNLDERPEVRFLLRGRWSRARVSVVTDPDDAARHLAMLCERVPGYHRPAGVRRAAGGVRLVDARAAIDAGRRVIELRVAA